jgi:hypothetical protein
MLARGNFQEHLQERSSIAQTAFRAASNAVNFILASTAIAARIDFRFRRHRRRRRNVEIRANLALAAALLLILAPIAAGRLGRDLLDRLDAQVDPLFGGVGVLDRVQHNRGAAEPFRARTRRRGAIGSSR